MRIITEARSGRALRLAAAMVLAFVGPFAVQQARGQTPAKPPSASFQPPLPTNDQQLAEQLKQFDPIAVTAARHYYESDGVKNDMSQMVRGLTPSVIESVEKNTGKPLDQAGRLKVAAAVDKATAAHFNLLVGLNMIAALETMTRDQLIALDTFYTSPIGQSILQKTPQLNARLPGIFKVFLPEFSESMEAEIKAAGIGTN